jgi:2,3-bisphosphoglycerate-independent phosphoglycerate mutase
VTYFWNGNRSGKFDDASETYVEVPSQTAPFEERPWMRAAEITDVVIAELSRGEYRHGRVNYANGDMVGHTGVLESTILAVEAVDLCIGRLVPVVERLGGALIVTADHGNSDDMFERDKKSGRPIVGENGRPRAKTSHTLSPVPFFVAPEGLPLRLDPSVRDPGLANVAATVLTLLGYDSPEDYEPSLLV